MTHWGITDGRVVIYDGHAAVAHVGPSDASAVALALIAGQSSLPVIVGDGRREHIDLPERGRRLRLARDCITVALGEG